ncbi:MAG: response regulator transcription factor [Desulfovibrio sp.]|nr:response regulator transcription factor [Desulfovibrio sp.]
MNAGKVIWIVEDDGDIRDLVVYALQAKGFAAEGFEDGAAFFAALGKAGVPPHLALLDVMLPGEDGLSLLKRLRAAGRTKRLPVIMLTAKGSEFDKVTGLDLGADDYLPKPFGVLELIARVNALLRRNGDGERTAKILSYKNILLDDERRMVRVDGEKIVLTFKEYELLRHILINAEIVLSRESILEKVWGYDVEVESRTLDMHIKMLRRKLGAAGGHIKTVRNVGYTLGE